MEGLRIRVRGQVQGVGFRPFIWRLAREFGLRGQVLNNTEGVLIEVWGSAQAFIAAIPARAPALARVDKVEVEALPGRPPDSFVIAASRGEGSETRVTPDAATCPDCIAEIHAPGRRQGYAFTNCTHCGPRFTILRGLPYGRAETTMAVFEMCAACRAEFDNPADRHFHAQTIACPACGPQLWFETGGRKVSGDAVALAGALLRQGGIVAVKGLGGFHLACDASDPAALARLRARKSRPSKPFALMGFAAALSQVVILTDADRALLADPAAPIVVAASRGVLPEAVAPGMASLGVMLPTTPLHHLLAHAFGGVLVMTSGNRSGEPQVIANDEARAKLSDHADGFLMHDRDIARRLDDGVERADPPMVLRRGRGRVPGTLPLPPDLPDRHVLALGGQMKAAICLVKNGQALLSHHIGDLDDAQCEAEFHKVIADYRVLFDHRPEVVAVDAHPGYRATQAGFATGLPVVEVQHHHAHLSACLAENLWPVDAGPVAGIILDGTGLGSDGTIWGGEVLLGDYHGITRLAHLRPAPLVGGDAAGRQPWRNALMRLDQAGLSGLADRLFADQPRDTLRAAAAHRFNAPLSSSAGRLFDAVAACLGIVPAAQRYEGEAAMRLEALAGPPGDGYPFGAGLDPAPMFQALCDDLMQGAAPSTIAARFHDGLATAFAAPALAAVAAGRAGTVVLSGGCFQNARLLLAVKRALRGLPVLTHRLVPANDGGLALGQALVAMVKNPGRVRAGPVVGGDETDHLASADFGS